MKRSRAVRSVIFLTIVPLVAVCAVLGAQPKPPALDLVLQRFREYLDGYNRDYATTVAQEHYKQRDGSIDRLLESECAMVIP